ncbi:MAG TPA: PAS domain S-box protein [Candidatus Angelobacter sp.]|nr:PAS domain S-box protein [Candidatus Angelobacter sp.]
MRLLKMPARDPNPKHPPTQAQPRRDAQPLPGATEAGGSRQELGPEEAFLHLAHAIGQLAFPQGGESGPVSKAPLDETEGVPSVQERYRVLVEQIPAVVFMAYIDGGVSEAYVSPQIEHVLGFTREEWLDDPVRWYHQIHPDDRKRWSLEAADMFLTGRPLKSVYRVLAHDGRVVWFQCEARLVRRKDGQPWFIHGVGVDVSELKETEQRLQSAMAERERLQELELERQIARTEQTESRLAAIVESSEDAIIGKTLEGEITTWNAAATRLFGYASQEIIGKSVLLIVPPELHDEELEIFRKLRAGERIHRRETQRLTKDGRKLDVSLTISPIRDGAGNVIGASSISRDITARKQEEERLRVAEKLATAGRFVATIAHEINNPLAAVTNLVYLARTSTASEPARTFLAQAEQELTRVAHLTKQTLGFYRETSGPSWITIGSLLPSLLAVFSSKTSNKGIQITSEIRQDPSVFVVPGEIRQVLANVLSNSIDVVQGGGRIRVRISNAKVRTGGKDGVLITIADSGSGIPSAIRPKLFEPFFTTKKDVGTGLGLWVCKNIVEKHGGRICLKSSVQPGRSWTAFSIFLPLRSAVAAVSQDVRQPA